MIEGDVTTVMGAGARNRPVNLANLCTLARIVLAPIFVLLFVQETLPATIAAAAVAVAIEMSDLADGFLARRRGEVSNLGKVLDPFADSIARLSAFLAFYAREFADLWMILVFFYRDSSVSFLRILTAERQFVMGARLSGKIKAWAQGIAILTTLGLILAHELGVSARLGLAIDVRTAGRTLVGIAAVVTLLSLADYLKGAISVLRAT